MGIFLFPLIYTRAQSLDQNVYRLEIGLTGGGDYYLGEANSQLFGNMRLAFSGLLRYKFDQRLALRVELNRAIVAGSGIRDNVVYAGDVCGEFNFFDLEKNEYKRFSKIFSPYIFTGVSLFTDVYPGQSLPEVGVPFGLGFKVILSDRWNIDLKWTNRLLLADNLEGYSDPAKRKIINDPYNNPTGLNGSNLLNNDLLSTFSLGISFNIWKVECDCKNTNYPK